MDYPALRLNIDRQRASLVGLSQKEVVDNVITALTSNQMIAPSYWVDPKSGNDYLLTVQYPETQVTSLRDLKQIPLRATANRETTQLDSVANITPIESPTEVDHYQLRRVIDVYVAPKTEELGKLTNSDRENYFSKQTAGGCASHASRLRAGHALLVQELWDWSAAFDRSSSI